MSKKGENAQKHTYYISKKSKKNPIIIRNSSYKNRTKISDFWNIKFAHNS